MTPAKPANGSDARPSPPPRSIHVDMSDRTADRIKAFPYSLRLYRNQRPGTAA